MWFSVWIWWSWNPLTGRTMSKHSGHLLADSLMKEVGRTVFMSHYTLAVFMSVIKGFFDFLFLPLLLVTLRSPIKYKKKNHLSESATTAEKLNHGPQLSIWCVVFFSVSLFYSFHISTLYAYDCDTHSRLWYPEEEHVIYEMCFLKIRLLKDTSRANNTVWFMTILGYPLPFSAFLQWQMEENIFPISRVSYNCA